MGFKEDVQRGFATRHMIIVGGKDLRNVLRVLGSVSAVSQNEINYLRKCWPGEKNPEKYAIFATIYDRQWNWTKRQFAKLESVDVTE